MPPCCDVCDRTEEAAGLTLVRFADFEPLPDGMVGHPRGLHWLCAEHAAALTPHTGLAWADARAALDRTAAVVAAAPSAVAGRLQLEWEDGDGTSGVHDLEGDLLWWTRPGGDGGRFGEAARSQALDDYRAHGPAVSCPSWVEAEVDRVVGRVRPAG